MDLTLTTQDVHGTLILSVDGEVDVHTAPQLRSKIEELTARVP